MTRTSTARSTTDAKRPGASRPSAGHAETRDEPGAQLPHERDESLAADQVAEQPSPDGVEQKAFEDAAKGRPDTTRGAEADQAYRKLRGG